MRMDYNRLKLTTLEKQRIIKDLEQEKDNLIWELMGACEQINNEIRLIKGLPTKKIIKRTSKRGE